LTDTSTSLPEVGQDRHQAVDREAAETDLADAGEVGGRDAGHFVRGAHLQLCGYQERR
jgi:hypothetical protein